MEQDFLILHGIFNEKNNTIDIKTVLTRKQLRTFYRSILINLKEDQMDDLGNMYGYFDSKSRKYHVITQVPRTSISSLQYSRSKDR